MLKKKTIACMALSVMLAGNLLFPSLALAVVRVDQTELVQGENAVGGGKATLADSTLDMSGVTAGELYSDQDLSVNFNGGNDIEEVNVAGSVKVDLSFSGDNEVEEVHATEDSCVTVNANGHNEFEEIEACDNSSLTINVTGENDFEEIIGRDDADITIRGTDCQGKDIVNLGKGEKDTEISTERGTLTIDHATVNLKGKVALIGSQNGDVIIDISKIAKDDGNEFALITAGGIMKVLESVIDIAGTVHSTGQMTIEHSDVKVDAPSSEYRVDSPIRVYSETGIELIREKNGKVAKGTVDGKGIWRIDTGDGNAVNLKADGEPAYSKCKGSKAMKLVAKAMSKAMPKTGDDVTPLLPRMAALASVAAAVLAIRRRQETAK